MEFIIGMTLGLIVGWNVIPQPEFVKTLMDYVVEKLGKKDEAKEDETK